jgi:hypothetical protein
MIQKGIDVVTRITNKRLDELKNGGTCKRMKNGDILVTWKRSQRKRWMSLEEYTTIPKTLTLRLVKVNVAEKGFRVKQFYVVTTLLDTETTSSESLAELYRNRWHVELDLNAIKTMMGLDQLRGKSPHMMRLELLVGLLAYNLIRLVILNSAILSEILPRSISFTACQVLLQMSWQQVHWMSAEVFESHIQSRLIGLSQHIVGDRPGRLEPRRLKRRQKAYLKLQEPRSIAKRKLMASRLSK